MKRVGHPLPKAASRRGALFYQLGDWLSLSSIFLFLALKTWRRTSDPIVDFPRYLYTAWRMSEGDLLYREISCWFGPLPHLVEATAFKLFGAGLDTLLWLNLAFIVALLFLWRAAFAAFSGKPVVWLVSLIFLSVFAFAQYTIGGNSNFLTPYASQASWGLAGLLLLIVVLQRDNGNFSPRWLFLAGLASAVAYLCKPEFVVAAGGCWLLYLLSWSLALRKSKGWLPRIGKGAGWSLLGFFSLWLPVFFFFFVEGGGSYAFQSVNWVPWSVLGADFRQASAASQFNAVTAGLNKPWPMLLNHVKWTAMAGAAYGGLWLIARFWEKQKNRRWLQVLLAIAVLAGAGGGAAYARWIEFGQAINFPAFAMALALFVLCLRAAWSLREETLAKLIPLGLLALPAALMLLRMILNGRIFQYGFFMMPLALCFVVALMMRGNALVRAAVGIMTLIACFRLASVTLRVASQRTLAVGEGRDLLYAFPFNISASGTILADAISQAPRVAAGARTLVALPYSSAFNYYLRLKNPVVAQEWNPDNLGFLGRDRVLRDLEAARPDLIFLFDRSLAEYGVPYFGYDEKSGEPILNWINANYTMVYARGHTANSPNGYAISFFAPNSAVSY